MDTIKLEDSRFLVKEACRDLAALKSVMESIVDQTDGSEMDEVVAVAIRTQKAIIADLQKATALMDEASKQ